eukprot:g63594.t1
MRGDGVHLDSFREGPYEEGPKHDRFKEWPCPNCGGLATPGISDFCPNCHVCLLDFLDDNWELPGMTI